MIYFWNLFRNNIHSPVSFVHTADVLVDCLCKKNNITINIPHFPFEITLTNLRYKSKPLIIRRIYLALSFYFAEYFFIYLSKNVDGLYASSVLYKNYSTCIGELENSNTFLPLWFVTSFTDEIDHYCNSRKFDSLNATNIFVRVHERLKKISSFIAPPQTRRVLNKNLNLRPENIILWCLIPERENVR